MWYFYFCGGHICVFWCYCGLSSHFYTSCEYVQCCTACLRTPHALRLLSRSLVAMETVWVGHMPQGIRHSHRGHKFKGQIWETVTCEDKIGNWVIILIVVSGTKCARYTCFPAMLNVHIHILANTAWWEFYVFSLHPYGQTVLLYCYN